MRKIEAAVAGARDAQRRVRVRLVEAAEAPRVVDDLGDPVDLRIEDSGVLRVVEQKPGRALRHGRLDRLDLGVAVAVPGATSMTLKPAAAAVDGFVGCEANSLMISSRCCVPAARVVRANRQHAGEDRVGSAEALQRARVHSRQSLETPPSSYTSRRTPCSALVRLLGMELRELRRADDQLVHDRWVFGCRRRGGHVDRDVVAERHLREAREVAQHLRLAELGERRRIRPAKIGRQLRPPAARRIRARESRARPASRAPVTSGSCQAAAWKCAVAVIRRSPEAPRRAGRCRPSCAAR